MASATDVRSILSLPAQSSAPALPTRSQQSHTTRKPDGISRELFSLIGDSAPSLAAQFAKPRLKQKPNLGGGESRVKWEWRQFSNSVRTDSLKLSHWTKASTDPEQDYPFARYNVQLTAYTYSQDEYSRLLEDPAWTKEETDYLFSVVREYDARWYVIHDRYDFPDGTPRSMEDIKDRYFTICKKLIKSRPWAGDEQSKAALIATFSFDKEREVSRKKYLESLATRTPEQMAEEEALYVEIKRLEQNERRFRRERDNVLRLVAGIDSGLPDVIEDESPFGSLIIDTKKRKKSGVMDIESPLTPSTIALLPAPIPPKRPSVKVAQHEAANCIIRIDPALNASYKSSHAQTHLRSFKMPTPKGQLAPKITQALAELGISSKLMVMYTRENIMQYESLLDAVSALVDTKKVIDKVDQDIRILKQRLGIRVSEEAPSVAGDAMEVDEGADGETADADVDAEVDEEGRAHSVVSTRSARSRKQSRRSSVSSVDTTMSVRNGGNKRQKKS